MEDASGSTYFLKTNIGDSRTNGLELYVEGVALRTASTYISLYTATALMDGRYDNGQIAQGNTNVDLSGKHIESVPLWTSRNGLQFSWKRWNAALQYRSSAAEAGPRSPATPKRQAPTGPVA